MHQSCKDHGASKEFCGKALDEYGDHAVTCGMGGHLFTRHGGLNSILCQAGRDAGYLALMEQVVPDFARWKMDKDAVMRLEEARVDVEFFGHPVAPSRYLDGTIRHPASVSAVRSCSRAPGVAAQKGEKAKMKRYPPRNGKEVIPCAMETWGGIGNSMETLLRELAVLASNKQLDRDVVPTKWFNKWTLQLNLSVAHHVSKALFKSLSNAEVFRHTVVCRSTCFRDCDVKNNGGEWESIPSLLSPGRNGHDPYPGDAD